jgi:CheY-like chemotaxis protein
MPNPRVLVVDDHPDTLRLFETYLSLSGFEVTSATSATEALRLAADGVDVIATDLAMPGVDGLEFIRRVRADAAQPAVPIVAVTGQAIDQATVSPADIGCCRVVLKPCDLDELAETLHRLVGTCVHDCARCPDSPVSRTVTTK